MKNANSISNKIKTEARKLGFFSCGISKAEFLNQDADRLKSWLEHGLHAGMDYMENHFDKRTDPRKLLPGAKSVISVLYNYYPKKSFTDKDTYHISKYAYGEDYHQVIKRKLHRLIEFMQNENYEINARAFVDSAPVLDRAWAVRSGLGWIGKNTSLITKEQGSYFFIGEIITDLELEYDNKTVANYCGGCTRCIDACPTNALKSYELDANKCISYWTIEYKGECISDDLEGKFENWIFGCDICQDVCPWNRLSEPHHEPDFEPDDKVLEMTKKEWKNLTEEQFKILFKESPLMRTKYSGLKRNIEFVKQVDQDDSTDRS